MKIIGTVICDDCCYSPCELKSQVYNALRHATQLNAKLFVDTFCNDSYEYDDKNIYSAVITIAGEIDNFRTFAKWITRLSVYSAEAFIDGVLHRFFSLKQGAIKKW